jgi:hypothetical protein
MSTKDVFIFYVYLIYDLTIIAAIAGEDYEKIRDFAEGEFGKEYAMRENTKGLKRPEFVIFHHVK